MILEVNLGRHEQIQILGALLQRYNLFSSPRIQSAARLSFVLKGLKIVNNNNNL